MLIILSHCCGQTCDKKSFMGGEIYFGSQFRDIVNYGREGVTGSVCGDRR